MKNTNLLACLSWSWIACSLSNQVFAAEAFNSGSTGAYGAMNITQDTTLDMPTNGIFHCTTITVASGATLRFNRNPLNTPVYLLATGDVTINGAIDVSGAAVGKGGPGGFDGGTGGSVFEGQSQGGHGLGPGGGGGLNSPDAWGRFVGSYGNLLLVPLIGGSGGAGSDGTPGPGGAGGGGAILVASNTRLSINGQINAYGGAGSSSGSGGGIRLVSPVITGTGSVNASCANINYGLFGRVRFDCQDNQAYRSLGVSGLASRGSRMVVFPAVIPQLDIIEAAGQAIAEGTASGVQFELPVGASTNQVIKVQARNFTGDIPIRVVVTPEHGPSGQFDATISQSSGNPPSTNVNVVIPVGSVCTIHAWTR